MLSHSLASPLFSPVSGSPVVMITIFPDLSISTLAIPTPAATAALMALVTSCCRKFEDARATSHLKVATVVVSHFGALRRAGKHRLAPFRGLRDLDGETQRQDDQRLPAVC